MKNASDLGVDPKRIAIGGASAGGGLTAGVSLHNRDHAGHDVAFQLLIYPMIDDRHDTSSGHEITYPTVWNRELSFKAWKMYLGDEYGTDDVSPLRRGGACQRLDRLAAGAGHGGYDGLVPRRGYRLCAAIDGGRCGRRNCRFIRECFTAPRCPCQMPPSARECGSVIAML